MPAVFAFLIVLTFVVGLLLAAPATGPATQPFGDDDPLGALRDQRRVIVLIAADATDERLARTDKTLRDEAEGVAEREITIIRVIAGRGAIGEQPLSATATARVLSHCDATAQTPFTVVLIGKDGGVKLRETEPVEAQRLFGLIDSMPMRQRETKR